MSTQTYQLAGGPADGREVSLDEPGLLWPMRYGTPENPQFYELLYSKVEHRNGKTLLRMNAYSRLKWEKYKHLYRSK